MLTQKETRDYFDYIDGVLYWKVQKSNVVKVGQPAGSLDERTGYYRIHINSKLHKTHRLIFLYHHGYMPTQVDHIDGDRMNNRIENLREATSSQNNQNRKATSSSGVKGVVWHKQSKKWIASICVNRKGVHLGSFLSIEEAALVANKARQSAHGEFYRGQA